MTGGPRARILAAIVVPPHMTASGAARAAERLSASLSPAWDVTVASMMAPQVETTRFKRLSVRTRLPPGLPWRLLPNRFATLFYRSDIPQRILAGNYDLVHLHNPTPGLELRRIARACRRAGVPYVVSTHGFNEVANGHAIFTLLKRVVWRAFILKPVSQVVRGATAILLLSNADASIVRAMGYRGPNLFVVPNGLDRARPADPLRDPQVLRKFDLAQREPRGPITCMFLANHTPNKGLPVLLRAFAALDIPYNLIIGGERRQDVDYQRAIDGVKPGQRIIVTGRLSDDEISVLMRRSDLFIFPTLADTLPLVVFEALAHGLPVLASNVGGIPHQIDESCGVLLPPGNAQALAAEIARLADDRDQMAAMAASASARAAKLCSWEEAAQRAEFAYSVVLDLGRQREAAHRQLASRARSISAAE